MEEFCISENNVNLMEEALMAVKTGAAELGNPHKQTEKNSTPRREAEPQAGRD